MGGVFSIVLSISMVGSVVAGFIIGFRQLFKKFLSRSFIFVLWSFVLVRLWLPNVFDSSLSIFNFIDITTPIELMTEEKVELQPLGEYVNHSFGSDESLAGYRINRERLNNDLVNNDEGLDILNESISSGNIDNTNSMYENEVNNNTFISGIIDLASIIWFIVFLILASLLFIMYVKINLLMKDKIYEKTVDRLKIYRSQVIESPVLVGVLRPVLVLPYKLELSDSQLKDIVKHEKVHIRRGDHILKPIWLFSLAFHWFNPILWLAYHLLMKDMEISCDEKVLKKYDHKEQCHYADTLLSISKSHNNLKLSALVAFGEKNISKRIKLVLKFKKMPLMFKILSPILIFLLFAMLLGQKMWSEPFESSDGVIESTISRNNDDLKPLITLHMMIYHE